ncbi:MAG TPA: FAD-dependent oxidoreductase [Vicinamibacterales bacterium]|jgi:glycine/D-amino acid oxidase-like deaminating enzyme
MPRLRVDVPLWLPQRRSSRLLFPSLHGTLKTDVVIVGGGITGAAAAWRFAEAGGRVALVEAARIGRGSTAASSALLMREPDEDFSALAKLYGKDRTRRIWQLSTNANRRLIGMLRQLEIACDLRLRDSVYYAPTQSDADHLRIEHRLRRDADLGGRWLSRDGVNRATGLEAAGAIRTSGDAQVDPYRACIGLMRAAASRGARIFERTPAANIKSGRHGVVVTTPRGAIHADRVIIATGYATPYFKSLLARFRMLNTYVVVTRRMSATERRRIGLGAVMLWDTGRPYHYARWTRDHRLMMGGGDRPLLPERERRAALRERTRGVHDHFLRLYPALAGIPLESAWEGLFATTPDSLPYVGPHRRYPRHLFALGYGGNGMTFGYLAAGLLLDWCQSGPSADHDLFAFSR